MIRTTLPPDIPSAPDTYDQDYMNTLVGLVRQLSALVGQRKSLMATTINVSALPTSATGLRSGDLWVDTTAANTIKKA